MTEPIEVPFCDVDSWSVWNRVLGESLNSLWEGAFLGSKLGMVDFLNAELIWPLAASFL